MTSSAHSNRIFSSLTAGERLSIADAMVLYHEADLLALANTATTRRNQDNDPEQVSYLIDRNINYTNVCNTQCSFCAFSHPDASHPECYVLSKEELGRKIEEAMSVGATRILLQGGLNDALPYEYYLDLISWIRGRYPIEINAFSAPEIQQMQRVSGRPYELIFADLIDAGLSGLPGGGAELLDDEIRRQVSPRKTRSDEWIRIMEIAQSFNLTTTATMVIGFGERIEHRLAHLARLRELQDRSRAEGRIGFIAFISWTLQLNEKTALGRARGLSNYKVSMIEYLRMVALARIFLDNVPHHQSSWPTMGPEVAQLSLSFGCDDFGSTMMEELVVSQAGAPNQHKWAMSPEELRQYITQAGYRAMQRNSRYEVVAASSGF